MCTSSAHPFLLDVTLIFIYFYSVSGMVHIRHNILVLGCYFFELLVVAISWQESMNLFY